MIINYYITDKLHYDQSICSKFFLSEIKYWGFNEFMFDNECCCQMKFFIEREECQENLKMQEDIIYNLYHKENFGKILPKARELVWSIVDEPRDPTIRKVSKFY